MEQMLGSYAPAPDGSPYTEKFQEEESPSGMIARSGTYNVRSRVIDDDGEVYSGTSWFLFPLGMLVLGIFRIWRRREEFMAVVTSRRRTYVRETSSSRCL